MKHEQYYDTETGQYVMLPAGQDEGENTPRPHMSQGSKVGIYTIVYFLLLAALMYPAQKAGLGEGGIFFAMMGAGLVFGTGWLLIRAIRRRIAASNLTGRGFFQLMVGYTPEQWEEEEEQTVPELGHASESGQSQALIPRTPVDLVALQQLGTPAPGQDSELPDMIIEDNPLYLSDTFQPNVDTLMAATILLCGIRRSGKSNGLSVLAEELGRYYCPLVIGDTEDEYSGLANRTFLPRGVLAGSLELYEELRAQGSELARYTIAIDQAGAYEFGQAVARDVLQVVLNLRSFASDEEAAVIMAEIMDGMSDWESSQPNHLRVPCMFFLDEANKWIPQNITESCVTDREALYLLQKAIFGTMVRRGGKRGLGIALATQRIAELDKRALQSTWKFLFRQTEENDLDRYAALGLDRASVQELRQGECFVFSPSVIGFPTHFRLTSAPHAGRTPGLAQLANHLRKIRPIDLVAASSSYASSVEAGPTTDAVQTPGRPRLSPELQRALDAYQPGMSYRDLGRAIGCGKDKAGELIQELRKRGLLQEEVEEEE